MAVPEENPCDVEVLNHFHRFVVRVDEHSGGGVYALGARGELLSVVEKSLEYGNFQTTIPLAKDTGDLALVIRNDDQLVVRVHGDARVLACRTDGRAVWVEAGVARFPVETVQQVLMLVGLYPDKSTRTSLETWIRSGADHTALTEIWGNRLDHVKTMFGLDHQRPDHSVPPGHGADQLLADELFDFLAESATWDDRATPEVVRRVHGPSQPPVATPVEVAPSVFESAPISTPIQSGPPFRPIVFVSTQRQVTEVPEPTPDEPTPPANVRVAKPSTPPALAPAAFSQAAEEITEEREITHSDENESRFHFEPKLNHPSVEEGRASMQSSALQQASSVVETTQSHGITVAEVQASEPSIRAAAVVLFLGLAALGAVLTWLLLG